MTAEPHDRRPIFTPATIVGTQLRCALYGPAGAGKTYGALRLATGLASVGAGRVAVIDSEHGRAAKYATSFAFDHCALTDYAAESYTAALRAAAKYDVVVVDSLSHQWRAALEQVDRAATRFRGNKFAAWAEVTPAQKRLIDAILGAPNHVLATMRVDTAYETRADGDKSRPVKVGLKPEQGKGIEYEFDLLIELAADNSALVVKDATGGALQGKLIALLDEDFGRDLGMWLAGLATHIKARPPEAVQTVADSGPPLPEY